MTKPTYNEACAAIRTVLQFIGENPDRPGLQHTPARFLNAWRSEWCRGYDMPEPELKMFPDEYSSPAQRDLVVIKDISLWSTCEHHLAPFHGTAHVAYIPTKSGVVGLSKFPRVVEYFSRRLQVQERLTDQIADYIVRCTESEGVGVVIKAKHLCMCSRGVNQPNAITTTSALRGVFFNRPEVRSEFLKLIHS